MASISANGAKGHHKFTLYVTEASTSTANNTSTINWSFDISAIQTSWDFYTIGSTITIKINDETVYNQYAQRSFDGYNTTTWASGSTTVAHNADGTKTMNISFSYSQSSTSSYTPGNASASGTMTLTTIPRYFSSTPTLSLSSRTDTSVTLNWSTSENASVSQYKINDGSWVDVETGINKKSGSMTISGLNPDTTYTIYGDFKRADSGLWCQTKPSIKVTTLGYVTFTNFYSYDVTETSSKFYWSTNVERDWTQYSLNGGAWTDAGDTGTTSGSFTISGLTAAKDYNIKIKCRRKDSGLWKESSTIYFSTYNYPYITAISNPNVTVGDEVNITVYNPLKRHCTAYAKQNNTSGKLLGSISGFTYGSASYNIPLDKNAMYESLPNSTTGNCVYYIVSSSPSHTSATVSGKYTIKETANNGEAKPTFKNFTIEDTDSTVLALTGDSSKIVLGYSDVKATISTTDKAIANKSSTMKTYKMLVGGETVTANYSSSSNVVLSLNNIKSNSIQVSAQDSRGFATAVTKTFTNLGYTEPVIKAVDAKLTRSNNGVGEQVTLTFSGKYWNKSFGAKTNSIVGLKYYYRKSNSTSDWIGPFDIYEDISYNNDVFSYNHIIGGDLENKGFDITESYSVRLYYRDELYSSYIDLTLGSGTPNIAIAKDGIAIKGKYDNTKGGALQVYGNSHLGKTTIDSNGCITLPSNVYIDSGAGIKLNNSDIIGANSIYFGDECGGHEGINFIKQNGDATNPDDYECLRGYRGALYYNERNVSLYSYPVGSIYLSSNSTSPATLFGGTWTKRRTYYGGELIAYGYAGTTSTGSYITKSSYFPFSADEIGATRQHSYTNWVGGILTFDSGTFKVNTKGVVGFVEAKMSISGLGNPGMVGFWFTGNNNALPSGVTELMDIGRFPLLTGPQDTSYGGVNYETAFRVNTSSDVSFYVNPKFCPYGGDFTPSMSGTGCTLIVKVYAKYGETIEWVRTA